MKKKIRGNKEFKIIPEAKIVVGAMPKKYIEDDFIHGVKEIQREIITEAAEQLDICYGEDMWYFDAEENTTVQATAYCDERDEWNEKRGMEVCSSKIDMKNHTRLAKQYSRIYRLLQETSEVVYRLCELHVKKAKAIEDDLVKHYGRLKV